MRRGVLVGIVAAACNGANLPAPPYLGTDTGTGTSAGTSSAGSGTGTGTGTTGTTMAASSTGTGPSPVVVLHAKLDLEIIENVRIQVTQTGAALDAEVTLSRGYGVAPAHQALVGPARIDGYPEAGAEIVTARFAAPAKADGPCGDAPVSLALSLHHDLDGPFVAGALTAYCGEDTWYGVPPIEPLRISGRIP